MLRRTLRVLFAIVVVFVMVAVSGTQTPVKAAVSIKMYKGPFGPNEVDQQNAIIAKFEKLHPDIQVTFETFDWPTQEQQITAAIAGGTHDVIYVPEGMYPKFAFKGGPLHDMSQYVNDPSFKTQKDNITYWDAATAPDGFLGGVPLVWITESIYMANLDMLKAAGVPDDWNTSLDKVRDAAIKMTKPGQFGIAFRTGGLAQFSQHDMYGYILRSGANYLTPDFKKCGLNTPELVKTFQWLVDLQNKDKVTPEFGQYTWDGLRGLFQAGKLGIIHDEQTLGGVLASKPPSFKYAFFDMPGLVNNNMLTFRGFWVIPEASQNKDAAWEMIKFWVLPENEVNYMNGTSGLYPALKDTGGIDVFPNDPVLKAGQDFAKYAVGPQFHPQMVEFQDNMQPLIDDMLQGKATPQQTIDDSCKMIESKLSQ